MAGAPERNANVFFVGAGLGSAFGIPNTQQLLDAVHALANTSSTWAATSELGKRLEESYEYFYPIEAASASGFRPSVVDFFSVLAAFNGMSQGLPGKLEGTAALYLDLRRALAHVLVNKLRDIDHELKRPQPALDAMLKPGSLVVTTNWDVLVERYCQHHSIPLRHRLERPEEEVTLLKLHGSIDWCLARHATRAVEDRDEYRTIRERLFGPRPYYKRPIDIDKILRVTALEAWSSGWSRIKSRSESPLLITMGMGKAADLRDVQDVWRDAYGAISRAKSLDIVGYSLPEDDIEIRTLLVAGLERGGTTQSAVITVQNPSPEVHDRFRAAVNRGIKSHYQPVVPAG